MENEEIKFIYSDKWNGYSLQEMTNSHLINSIMKLWKERYNWKNKMEVFVLDNTNNELLHPVISLEELARISADDWIETTPLYQALLLEVEKRNLFNYYIIVKDRYEKSIIL